MKHHDALRANPAATPVSDPRPPEAPPLLEQLRSYWEAGPCGAAFGTDSGDRKAFFAEIEAARYRREPFIKPFARFADGAGRDVLEIGVGAGTDFAQWVRAGARATGVDLTDAGIRLTRERLVLEGFRDGEQFTLQQANAERLPFPDASFDLVYAWGVLHHSPDPALGFREAGRVLRPGGELRAMVYHPVCWATLIAWIRHALLRGRPWIGIREAAFHHLESPGTKTFTGREVRAILSRAGFDRVALERTLSTGDLLMIELDPRRRGWGALIRRLLNAAYPRWLVRLIGPSLGLNLTIVARKSSR